MSRECGVKVARELPKLEVGVRFSVLAPTSMCTKCGNLSLKHEADFSRRHFLQLACGAVVGLTVQGRSLFAASDVPAKPQNVISSDEALHRLMEGNDRYVKGIMKRHDFASERTALSSGQNPFAGILSCADSRVAPEYAFDTGRGDLFVVRVAGNFTNDDVVASFEYTVKFLGTPLLVVLGHEKCGAVDATIKTVKNDATLPGHLPILVEKIRPAVKAAEVQSGDLLENAIRQNVILNVKNLKEASPIISQYVEEKKARVVGGIYKLDDGRIDWIL